MEKSQQALEVRNLTVRYGDVTALKDIDFTVDKNTLFGVIGPNGGGKSTLLKALIGLVPASAGTIRFQEDAKIGYVPQSTEFDKGFPILVRDVVLMGSLRSVRLLHRHDRKDKERAGSIMRLLGISGLSDRQIGQLSGGQLQKVLIARALMSNPNVLVLDEPTAAIDATAKKEIHQLLAKLKSRMTILLVSHDMDELGDYLDDVLCINQTAHTVNRGRHLATEGHEAAYECPVKIFVENERQHHLHDHDHDSVDDNGGRG